MFIVKSCKQTDNKKAEALKSQTADSSSRRRRDWEPENRKKPKRTMERQTIIRLLDKKAQATEMLGALFSRA